MRISDWSSDVCSSDLDLLEGFLRIRSKACSPRERDPFLPSVPVLRRERNAAHELALDDRDVDDATDIDSVEATARDLTHHAEIVCRFAGDDADRATDGVASEQRTLRALQDLEDRKSTRLNSSP